MNAAGRAINVSGRDADACTPDVDDSARAADASALPAGNSQSSLRSAALALHTADMGTLRSGNDPDIPKRAPVEFAAPKDMIFRPAHPFSPWP